MDSLQSRLSRAEQLYLQGAMQAALAAQEREIQLQQQQQQQQQRHNGEEESSDRSSRFTPSPIESLCNSAVIDFHYLPFRCCVAPFHSKFVEKW